MRELTQLIHERKKSKEYLIFKKFKTKPDCPLIAVPSTYSKVKEIELIKNGFQIVIYANQELTMINVAKKF